MTPAEHVANVRAKADDLADALVAATNDGVSHPLILPQLVLAFREKFGGEPPNIAELMKGLT